MIKQRPHSAQKAHGTFAKHFQPQFAARQDKRTLGVIHPIPTTQPRQRQPIIKTIEGMSVQSKCLTIKQKKLQKKPVPEQLLKPFMYVEKVVNRRRTENTAMKHSDVWNYNTAIDTTRKPKKLNQTGEVVGAVNKNVSLYDVEEQKRKVAKEFFERLSQADPHNSIMHQFHIWAKDRKLKLDRDYNVSEDNIKAFIKDATSDRIKSNLVHDFFECFSAIPTPNERVQPKPKKPQRSPSPKSSTSKPPSFESKKKLPDKQPPSSSPIKPPISILTKPSPMLSIRALHHNYRTFLRTKTEVTRIMSQKAAQQRYTNMKIYIEHWCANYSHMKQTMNNMKDYENQLRKRFVWVRESYQNPFVGEIEEMRRELQQPMIKYDKPRKEGIEKKIEEYLAQHQRTHSRVHEEYQVFAQAFQDAILNNHNLFFKKKTIMKLLKPVFDNSNKVTKEIIEQEIGRQQQYNRYYLQVLSQYSMGFAEDKKMLKQATFTFAEFAKYLAKTCQRKQDLSLLRKLVKNVKYQYCLKNQLFVEDMQQFPGDQQVQMDLLNKCFQIQCTRVLFKSQIWDELLQNISIPERTYDNKYHSQTIDMNITLESTRRLFDSIDKQMSIELNKSRQICNLVQRVSYDQFATYSEIISKINLADETLEYESTGVNTPGVEGILRKFAEVGEEEEEEGGEEEEKRVKFADMLYTNLDKLREMKKKQQEEGKGKKEEGTAMKMLGEAFTGIIRQKEEEINKIVGDLTKVVLTKAREGFDQSVLMEKKPSKQRQESPQKRPEPAMQLSMMKTLTKSFYVNDPININALDARFHDSSMQKIQQQKRKTASNGFRNTELAKSSFAPGATQPPSDPGMQIQGKSILLSNLPKVQQLSTEDPLRISKYLLKTLDKIDQEQSKHIQPKKLERTIRQGVDHNYFKQKVDFEKKPTVFDCQGASKYSLLLPVDYYSNAILQQTDKDKWYLRSHHVQTLTENPLSKKDNIVSTEYKSHLERLQPKKRPDEFVIEENVRRKDVIIGELQQRVAELKQNLSEAKRSSSFRGGARVPAAVVDNYFNRLTKDKQGKELEVGAYQSILYDLRKQQRDLLVGVRGGELAQRGYPQQKWWELKDKNFVDEFVRHRNIEQEQRRPPSEQKHLNHIRRLQNEQLY